MRLNRKNNVIAGKREGVFSAIEMLVSVFLIMAILGVAVAGMRDMQRRNFSETSRVDTVQETRDFVDQVVRDVHNVGYPPGRVLNGNPTCVNNAAISCGVITFSPLQVIYEGDLDGTGTVSQIWLLLAPGPGNRCPCILQRGVITKAAALGGAVPQYFTEVNGVLNSGTGAGGTNYPIVMGGPENYAAYGTADVFSAYDVNGAPIGAACATPVACSAIRSLQITANVAPNYMDPTTKLYRV